MNDGQKNCILLNHNYFVTNMADVKRVCDYILSSGALTQNMVEEIMVERTHTDRVRALNTLMPKRPARAFDAYCGALTESGNEDLAQRLKPFLTLQGVIESHQVGDGGRLMATQTIRATSGTPNTRVPSLLSSSHQEQHIMISYETSSRPILICVRDALRERGYKVWMDVENLTGNINDAMAAAVENSSIVLVAGSHTYITSSYCKEEIQYARKKKKPIIPLSMEPDFVSKADGWFGLITSGLKYIEFTEDSNFTNSLNELVKELEALDIGTI